MQTTVVATAVAITLALSIAACGSDDGDGAGGGGGGPGEGPNVVSTVAPITDLVRQVMGERGEPTGLVPDGVDSHTYEPQPQDAQILSDAELFVANGLFLEEPSLDMAEANMPGDATVVTLADNTIDRDEWAFDFSFPEADDVPNPHLWLNIAYAMDYVEQIRDALIEVDPDGGSVYTDNADAYLDELTELDEAVNEAVGTIPTENRKLVTYHDSWPYFGERYDIDVVGAVQPSDFSEPSAAEVRQIIEQVRDEDIPAVFGSEVFPSDVVAAIADDAGATYVEELSDDELPGEAGDSDHSYTAMMVGNVRTMVENLGGDPAALEAVDRSGG
ncbi:metal ABC transporter substrate-binding protein [soil metagenome]